MARPVGVAIKTKDNSRKKHRENEEFQKGKKLGRPKQVWVWDDIGRRGAFAYPNVDPVGHWEKVK